MSEIKRKRGRPFKADPQIIAGWRFAKGTSIAETAERFGVSPATVKRACAEHMETGLLARHAWFAERAHSLFWRWNELIDIGNFWEAGRVEEDIRRVERELDQTQQALAARGIAHAESPRLPRQSPENDARLAEARKRAYLFH